MKKLKRNDVCSKSNLASPWAVYRLGDASDMKSGLAYLLEAAKTPQGNLGWLGHTVQRTNGFAKSTRIIPHGDVLAAYAERPKPSEIDRASRMKGYRWNG